MFISVIINNPFLFHPINTKILKKDLFSLSQLDYLVVFFHKVYQKNQQFVDLFQLVFCADFFCDHLMNFYNTY